MSMVTAQTVPIFWSKTPNSRCLGVKLEFVWSTGNNASFSNTKRSSTPARGQHRHHEASFVIVMIVSRARRTLKKVRTCQSKVHNLSTIDLFWLIFGVSARTTFRCLWHALSALVPPDASEISLRPSGRIAIYQQCTKEQIPVIYY